MKSPYGESQPFVTRDGSLIRELMHPDVHGKKDHGVNRQSLAEATVPAGISTILHKHHQTEELYYIIAGEGLMTLADDQFDVEVGDTICIPPGTPHCIKNIGMKDLKFLCCCSPAYSHDDTEMLA
jgi:mannose-6-phosphate isomerase-like protein (cupin superfamily)